MVPKYARFQVLRMAHDDTGHFGFEKTHELVASQYLLQHMRRVIKKYANNCLNCLYFKSSGGKPPGFLHPIKKIPKPFHTIHVDHIGAFVKSISGNTQILVIIDAFTKFILIYAVKNSTTKVTLKCLKDMIKTFGAPYRIISDQGTSFTSADFKQFCQENGINHHLNAVAMPRGNGQVERYNKILLDSLATMGAEKNEKRWDEKI